MGCPTVGLGDCEQSRRPPGRTASLSVSLRADMTLQRRANNAAPRLTQTTDGYVCQLCITTGQGRQLKFFPCPPDARCRKVDTCVPGSWMTRSTWGIGRTSSNARAGFRIVLFIPFFGRTELLYEESSNNYVRAPTQRIPHLRCRQRGVDEPALDEIDSVANSAKAETNEEANTAPDDGRRATCRC